MNRNRNAKHRRGGHRLGAFVATVAVLAFVALALTPVLLSLSQRAREAVPEGNLAQAGLTLADVNMPQPTEVPAPTAEAVISLPPVTPTPEPTPELTPEPTPQPTPFLYLPVIYRAHTEQKRIAVTVDDCYQLENLKTIVQLAEDSGAKLTLFPVGENLAKPGMPELLRHSAFDLGFEIENHTYTHARIFRLPEAEMAAEIWNQRVALNRALGCDYQQHFLRLMGGDGETDQRTHNYLKQLGYYGIAKWSVSGSDSDMAHIESALAPGQIYLFHTTDADTAKLEAFIPWAVSQGYELVTMNALLGMPENATAPLEEQAMPQPVGFSDDGHTQKEGDYAWAIVQLQDALRQMGYLELDGPSTGYYGPQTAQAVAAFQADHGLEPSGEADAATQALILGGI